MREIIARFDDEDKKPFVYGEEVGELIRCKDCAYNHDGECWGFGDGHLVNDEDFCASAERKE